MSIMTALRSAVKTIDKIGKTGGMQADVGLVRFLVEPGQGNGTYSNPITLPAFVDFQRKQVRTMDGVLTVSRATVIFTDKAALLLATNNQGVGNHDRIVLPDGDIGSVLDLGGYVDPIDGLPVATEAILG